MSPIVVSASGKVLIAGGYLVLDQKYSGIVVSTSSRFYTVIDKGKSGPCSICVQSPQFKDAVWNYSVNLEGSVNVEQNAEDLSKNKFVHIALQQVFRLAVEIKGYDLVTDALSTGLHITIAGDNDFYSQRAKLAELGLESRISSLKKIPPFSHTGVSLSEVHKTGLGSSAALITSLVAALFISLGIVQLPSIDALERERRALIHNTAQFIHCLAQGKIGSGFDVAAAVFGSQIYTRFNPAVISKLMTDPNEPLLRTLSPSNSAWDYVVDPFQLPPLVRLMLADVDAGSDTPSLVGKVLKWRETKPSEANELWNTLARENNALAKVFRELSRLHDEDRDSYTKAVERLSSAPATNWPPLSEGKEVIIDAFHECHEYTEKIREKMCEMGQLSGVPIEPPEQTELLNACVAQAGVIGGGVPGAGGYDAIWILVLDQTTSSGETPADRVENVWLSWKKLDVSPLLANESHDKGLRVEKFEDVPGLKSLVA